MVYSCNIDLIGITLMVVNINYLLLFDLLIINAFVSK